MISFARLVLLGACAGALLATIPAGTAAAQSAERYAALRQAAMKELSAHSKAIAAFVKGDKNPKKSRALGTAGDVELRATAMASLADRLPNMFAQKTSLADIPGKTRAKPAIWSDWNKFYAATQTLKTMAQALEKAAATGDKEKIGAAQKAIGKDACAACHKAFRGPKPKKTM